jgi:hypothetical protein
VVASDLELMTSPVAAQWHHETRREEERADSLSWEVVAAEVAARRRPAWGEDAGHDKFSLDSVSGVAR